MIPKSLFLMMVCLSLLACDSLSVNSPSLSCDQIIDPRMKILSFPNLTEEKLRLFVHDQFKGITVNTNSPGVSWGWTEGERYFHAEINSKLRYIGASFGKSKPFIRDLISCIGQPSWYRANAFPNTTIILLFYPEQGILAISDMSGTVNWFEIAIGRRLMVQDKLTNILHTQPGTKEEVIRNLYGAETMSELRMKPWPESIDSLPPLKEWPYPGK